MKLFRKRMSELEESCRNGEISERVLREKINGWMEYARYGNTHKLRLGLIKNLILTNL